MSKSSIDLYVYGVLFAILLCISAAYQYGTSDTVTFKVEDKERVCSGGENPSCKYLVYTDAGTFKNTDALLQLKFNSADLQGALKVGKVYQAKIYGWRSGFFSMFPNIVSISEVKQPA